MKSTLANDAGTTMLLIAISHQSHIGDEPQTAAVLLENGLDVFHVRKPKFSEKLMKKYIEKIPAQYRNRIVIHSHYGLALKYNLKGIHITGKARRKSFRKWLSMKLLRLQRPHMHISASFHSLGHLYDPKTAYDYIFLSPVFDSISKSGYQSGFSEHGLKVALSKTRQKVIALGGVGPDKIGKVKEMGFHGMALHGALWESASPLEAFKVILAGNSTNDDVLNIQKIRLHARK